MKQGFASIQELANRLQADKHNSADYVAVASTLRMDAPVRVDGPPAVLSQGPASFEMAPISATGHRQIAEYTNIPAAYYDRMLSKDPELLADNVNRWLRDKTAERRMVRTLNGNVRALLSDRYQRIDNLEVAEVALNVLSEIRQLKVVSSQVTESRMYIKAVSSSVQLPVPGSRRVGDLVETGVIISNSEIGMGSVSIKPFAHFLACTNGMVRDDGKLRAAHVGRRIDADIEGLLSDSTRRLEDEVVLRKVRDVIKHAFDEAVFRRFIEKLGATTKTHIQGDVPASVERLGQTIGLMQYERSSVLRHLIQGGDLSQYGVINAITRTAEDVESYDRATELETLGYRVIDLSASQWREISDAKPLALAA